MVFPTTASAPASRPASSHAMAASHASDAGTASTIRPSVPALRRSFGSGSNTELRAQIRRDRRIQQSSQEEHDRPQQQRQHQQQQQQQQQQHQQHHQQQHHQPQQQQQQQQQQQHQQQPQHQHQQQPQHQQPQPQQQHQLAPEVHSSAIDAIIASFQNKYVEITLKCKDWQEYAARLKTQSRALSVENRLLRQLNERQLEEVRALRTKLDTTSDQRDRSDLERARLEGRVEELEAIMTQGQAHLRPHSSGMPNARHHPTQSSPQEAREYVEWMRSQRAVSSRAFYRPDHDVLAPPSPILDIDGLDEDNESGRVSPVDILDLDAERREEVGPSPLIGYGDTSLLAAEAEHLDFEYATGSPMPAHQSGLGLRIGRGPTHETDSAGFLQKPSASLQSASLRSNGAQRYTVISPARARGSNGGAPFSFSTMAPPAPSAPAPAQASTSRNSSSGEQGKRPNAPPIAGPNAGGNMLSRSSAGQLSAHSIGGEQLARVRNLSRTSNHSARDVGPALSAPPTLGANAGANMSNMLSRASAGQLSVHSIGGEQLARVRNRSRASSHSVHDSIPVVVKDDVFSDAGHALGAGAGARTANGGGYTPATLVPSPLFGPSASSSQYFGGGHTRASTGVTSVSEGPDKENEMPPALLVRGSSMSTLASTQESNSPYVRKETHSTSSTSSSPAGVTDVAPSPRNSTPGHNRSGLGLGLQQHDGEADGVGPHRQLYARMRSALGPAHLAKFEKYVHRYDGMEIPLEGPRGLINRVRCLLLRGEPDLDQRPDRLRLMKDLLREFEALVRIDIPPNVQS